MTTIWAHQTAPHFSCTEEKKEHNNQYVLSHLLPCKLMAKYRKSGIYFWTLHLGVLAKIDLSLREIAVPKYWDTNYSLVACVWTKKCSPWSRKYHLILVENEFQFICSMQLKQKAFAVVFPMPKMQYTDCSLFWKLWFKFTSIGCVSYFSWTLDEATPNANQIVKVYTL